ncbi:cytochrome P450 family protein [Streptomyces sp. NRRL F-5135]|uniref:cytochrome P450 family protein n=1 Tax=Streptomyces sp. NRRL F-5135 TaxID=1463858 RepID=UPI0006897214|nr:cytochrome P450 [Streptomyces sp. NRRL F-5135]
MNSSNNEESRLPPYHAPIALDEDFFSDPHASYTTLRRKGGVHRAVTQDGAPLFLVTGYREVREAAVSPSLSLNKCHARSVGRDGSSMPPELDAHLLNTDPPAHTRLRRLVNSTFTPRRTEHLRTDIEEITDRLLDRISSRRRADVMTEFAMPLSMEVICRLLGIPQEKRIDFRAWTDTLLSPAAGSAPQSREAMRRMHRFLITLIEVKREEPGDDLLSALILAHDEEDRLTADELVAMAFLLLFGGYHNTASLIATSAMALLSNANHLSAFRSGDLTTHAVTEEALRWNPPAMLAARRFATRKIHIGDVPVVSGDRIWLSWAAANRDPERFERPETFDPHRENNTHLSFGHGLHYCPGASLARLENSIAVASLTNRFPALSLVDQPGDLRWVASPRSRSLNELRVDL